MPTLFFPMLGRLGNNLFIYAHARAWAEQNGYELCVPPWVGEKIFAIPEAIRPDKHKPDLIWPERMYQDQASLIYTRKQVKEWFQIKPELLDKLSVIPKPDLLCDLRQGQDYLDAGLVCLSKKCYWDAVASAGYDPGAIEWELDTSPTRLPFFTGDVNSCGLGTSWVSLPAFYRMMSAKVHFRANSTFSWWASTLGNARVFAPIIKGMKGGMPEQYCNNWTIGNWPVMADCPQNSDLHLKES